MHLSRKNFKNYLALKGISRVIKILTLSDILMMGGFGLVSPIFAVFITDTISGGTLGVAGIAITIYLLTKSIGQIFAAEIIDKIKGEMDDFWSVFIGSILMSLVYLLYLFIHTPTQLYLIQFLLGLTTAFTFPSWMAIYTRHIDHNLEGREWGAYFTLVDLVTAGTAAIGGAIAYSLGFAPLFIIVAVTGLLGSLVLWFIRGAMIQKRPK